jgi:hypothetical protein
MYNLNFNGQNRGDTSKGRGSGYRGKDQRRGPSPGRRGPVPDRGKDKFDTKNGHDPKDSDEDTKSDESTKPGYKFNQDQIKYREMLNTLNGSLKANLIDDKFTIIQSVPVRDLTESLKKSSKDTTTVVFDGVVSQRLVDIAVLNNITKIVAMKIGNVTKQPMGLDIILKTDLE